MLTREEALRKHREMWEAMQRELGDYPDDMTRLCFKQKWCKQHDGDIIDNFCYLCDYVNERGLTCNDCPIDWGNATKFCIGTHVDYRLSPIYKILALPEREVPNEDQS